MTDTPQPVDFDSRPPMPIAEYEETVRRVSTGYDLFMTLTLAFLRAQQKTELNLLVVGAGGGAEIERFLPDNPGWRLTGVDPSQDMLAVARDKAERTGVAGRVTLVGGVVEDLPPEATFDAATCLFVLHFLPDDAKLALLRGVRSRLKPGAPLIIAAGTAPEPGELGRELLGAWQAYGELMGMPPERMAAVIQEVASRPGGTTAQDYERLFREAGFERSVCYLSVLTATRGWQAC